MSCLILLPQTQAPPQTHLSFWVSLPACRCSSGELMFDHVKFGISDYAAIKAFFLKALE